MSSLVRKIISTAKAPAAIGPYSQAVLVDRTIYISGQLGMDPASGQLVPGGVAEEAKQDIYIYAGVGIGCLWKDIQETGNSFLVVAFDEGSSGGRVRALTNIGEILKAAGCDFTNVVKATVLLADINDFSTVNDVYKQYFQSSFPARAAYQVAALPKGGRVEIEAIAVQGPLTTASL